MDMLAAVVTTVNSQRKDPAFWTDDMAAIRLLVPALHALQSVTADGPLEMVRLAGLMLLSMLKGRFGLSAADLVPLRRSLVASIATLQPSSPSWRWEIWALVTAALQVEVDVERVLILEALRNAMVNANIASAEKALNFAKGMIWAETHVTDDVRRLLAAMLH
jgi:hypothetical protein